jgi:tripartite-type tricarboxylate transporter receptor subunit TctC
MPLRRRDVLRWGLLALAAPAAGVAARTAFPESQPIRVLVAYPPGGLSDEITRVLADKLALRLGVPVLVEHRPGAGGAVAMRLLARAAPDGHTLCFSAITALSTVPHLTEAGYDPLRDIAPVAAVMATPVLVVATPALHARSMADVVAHARAWPGSVRWATSGVGTTGHLVLEQVRAATGVEFVHVPYKGGAQQITEALGGQFELLSTNVAPAQLELVRSGRLTALAVGAPARLDVLPDVPTLAELGMERANLMSLFALFAPAHTPAAVIERLNDEVNRALKDDDLRQRLRAASNAPAGGEPDELGRRVEREWTANRSALKQ